MALIITNIAFKPSMSVNPWIDLLCYCDNCGEEGTTYKYESDLHTSPLCEYIRHGLPALLYGDDSTCNFCFHKREPTNTLKGENKMSNNYIMLRGKKVELTKEQIEEFEKIFIRKSDFARTNDGKKYYYIDEVNEICSACDYNDDTDDERFNAHNYCTNEKRMEFRLCRRLLNYQLESFRAENEIDKVEWGNDASNKYIIYYDYKKSSFEVGCFNVFIRIDEIYFNKREVAETALDVFKSNFDELKGFYLEGL